MPEGARRRRRRMARREKGTFLWSRRRSMQGGSRQEKEMCNVGEESATGTETKKKEYALEGKREGEH